jgi:lipid-binding SYLF domain-containing protein
MKKYILLVTMLLAITSCANISPEERKIKIIELDKMEKQAVADLIKENPALQDELGKSLGYAVANMKLTKVPIVGGGGGEGVFVNLKEGKRAYFTVSRFDIGGGWGVRAYKILIIVNTQKVLDRVRNGVWEFQAGAEASAGTASAEGSSASANDGYKVHVLSEGGASVTATARVIRIKVNKELSSDK